MVILGRWVNGGEMGVKYQQTGSIGRLTLDDPETLNSMSDQMWASMSTWLHERVGTGTPQSVVITGAGRVFSAGGDINRMRAALTDGRPSDEFQVAEAERMRRISSVLLQWVRAPFRRVAAVHGCAVGSGLAVACSCDYRIVASNGFFDSSFARIGLPGDTGISYLLTRLIGAHRSRDWLLRPRRIHAEEALRIGLVDEVVPEHLVLERAEAVAAEYAAGSTDVSAWVDKLVPRNWTEFESALELEATATAACKESQFHRGAVEEFLSKPKSK